MLGFVPKVQDYILCLVSYKKKNLDNNIIIYKEIFSCCNQYFKIKTKLICNKQLKTNPRLLVTVAII